MILTAVSCYTPRYMYSPAAVNVPVVTQKGNSKIAFNLSSNLYNKSADNTGEVKYSKASGYDIHTAYAFSKNFAFQANHYRRKEKNNGNFSFDNIDSIVIEYKRNVTEIGIGYFTPVGERQNVFFQVFAGIGKGRFALFDTGRDADSNYYKKFHRASVTKFYIQPAFLINAKKNFTASFASRISVVQYSKIYTDYNQTELNNYKLDSLTYTPRVFWEPAIINTFGFKKLPFLKLEFQTGFSILTSKSFIDYRTFNFSLGIIADLTKVNKKQNTSSHKN